MLILRGIFEITATFRLHKEATLATERAAILKSQHTFPQYASVLAEIPKGVWVPAPSFPKSLVQEVFFKSFSMANGSQYRAK